ncbi:hypothetical protein [Aquimarina sp. 2201CG5-10]|uniref:hypothetical protein n=1 Tax=Aquimarina callyspongiae TaxID=3098150 RepID=UPI002AB53645|nr:hypothetical protein [Aquimarina sp. 2201CG5-10]MDY8136734.1 hypothetical protein [Aquimarina sp. 2201CG5-10]
MHKINIKLPWLGIVIFGGLFVFMIFPQIQKQYKYYDQSKVALDQKEKELEVLQKQSELTQSQRNKIKTLTISIPVEKKAILKQQFNGLKIGGIIACLVFMGVGAILTRYLGEKKKILNTINKDFEFTNPEESDIGRQVSWVSTKSSGSNFLSERVKKTNSGYKIGGTAYVKIFAWSFFLMGAVTTIISFIELYRFSEKKITLFEIGKIFFTTGGVFVIIGVVLLLLFSSKAVFHIAKRKIVVEGIMLPFEQVIALQVLEKFVEGNNSGSFYSYEMNLVTKKGDRYNLLNHGDKTALMNDVILLGDVLKVPVWSKVYL